MRKVGACVLIVALVGMLALPILGVWQPELAYADIPMNGWDPVTTAQAVADAVSQPYVMTFSDACAVAGCTVLEGQIMHAMGTAAGYFSVVADTGWQASIALMEGIMADGAIYATVVSAASGAVVVGAAYVWLDIIPNEIAFASSYEYASGHRFITTEGDVAALHTQILAEPISGVDGGWSLENQQAALLLVQAGESGCAGGIEVSGTATYGNGYDHYAFDDVWVNGVRLPGDWFFSTSVGVAPGHAQGVESYGMGTTHSGNAYGGGSYLNDFCSLIVAGGSGPRVAGAHRDVTHVPVSSPPMPGTLAIPANALGGSTPPAKGVPAYPHEGVPPDAMPPHKTAPVPPGTVAPPDGGVGGQIGAIGDGLQAPPTTGVPSIDALILFLVAPFAAILHALAATLGWFDSFFTNLWNMFYMGVVPNPEALGRVWSDAVGSLQAAGATHWPFAIGPWAGGLAGQWSSGGTVPVVWDFNAWSGVPVHIDLGVGLAWIDPYRWLLVAFGWLACIFGIVQLFRPHVEV